MTWRKIGSKTNYLDFIRSIEGEIVTNPLGPDLPEKSIFIRHDVDVDIDGALLFAEMEHRENIKSTYFLLPTAKYFDYQEDFGERITLLAAMGHEIGLHNNILSIWWNIMNMKDPDFRLDIVNIESVLMESIKRPLDFLREHTEIKAVSCHGAREHYDRRYFNYQYWTQWNSFNNEGFLVRWPQVSLYTLELLYEAYFLPYTHYFSDSGNNWIGYVTKKPKPFERTALYSKDNIGTNIINKFNKADKGLFQLLIHPQHWEKIV